MNTREQIRQAFEDYANGRLAVIPATMQSRTNHSTEYDPKTAKIVD
jgi:hypothetical protein